MRPKLPLTITEPCDVPPFTGGLSGLSFVGLEEPDGVCHVVVAAMGAENALAMANRVVAAWNMVEKVETLLARCDALGAIHRGHFPLDGATRLANKEFAAALRDILKEVS